MKRHMPAWALLQRPRFAAVQRGERTSVAPRQRTAESVAAGVFALGVQIGRARGERAAARQAEQLAVRGLADEVTAYLAGCVGDLDALLDLSPAPENDPGDPLGRAYFAGTIDAPEEDR